MYDIDLSFEKKGSESWFMVLNRLMSNRERERERESEIRREIYCKVKTVSFIQQALCQDQFWMIFF